MSPTSEAKPKQFAFVMSDAELRMLKDLAEEAHVSAAETIRALVRMTYTKKFKCKIPGASIMPTLRAIIDDIIGPPHFTGGNIATRTGLPPQLVQDLLQKLKHKRIVECVDAKGPVFGQKVRFDGENWTWQINGTRELVLERLVKEGFDVDADLTPKT